MKYVDIRFFARTCLVAIAALSLVSCGSGDDDDVSTNNATLNNPQSTQAAVQELVNAFAATLTGAQEVPPRPSGATGSGTVVVNANTRVMTATLTTTDVAGNAAHIHQAPSGVNGPVIFPLNEASPGSGVWTTTATLTEAQYNTLRAGGFYFNVHSAAFPDGELRGQIGAQLTGSTSATTGSGTGTTATGATGTGTTSTGTGASSIGTGTATGGTGGVDVIQGVTSTSAFITALRGQHAVPVAQTSAQGSGTVLINPATRQMIAAIASIGMTGSEAHIHEGALGATGPVVVPLVQTGAGSGVWIARATLTEAQYNALQAGNMYFEVHSVVFPSGEIRGQILPQKLSLPLVTGALGSAGTPNAPTIGSGTPSATGTTGNPAASPTGTGIPAGTTGTGFGTGIGTGIGIGTGMTTGTGTIGAGTGITGTGAIGTGTTGTGGVTGSGIGTIGTGAVGTGTTGIGTTGIGTTGVGTTGTSTIGTGGIGTTGSGFIGTTPSGPTVTGAPGTGTLTTPLPGTTSTGTGTAGLVF